LLELSEHSLHDLLELEVHGLVSVRADVLVELLVQLLNHS
jgi:hypothetical protein